VCHKFGHQLKDEEGSPVEVVAIRVWFCAIVVAGTAFAVTLILRAILADNRYPAQYEQPGERPAIEQPEREGLPRAA
jgi:hypothetical protein